MSWTLPWPSEELEILAWAQTILIWSLALYGFGTDPVGRYEVSDLKEDHLQAWSRRLHGRAGVAAVVVIILGGFTVADLPGRLMLSFLTYVSIEVVPRVRHLLAIQGVRPSYVAEWETGANLLFGGVSGLLIGGLGIGIVSPIVRVPLAAGPLSCVIVTVAAPSARRAGRWRGARGHETGLVVSRREGESELRDAASGAEAGVSGPYGSPWGAEPFSTSRWRAPRGPAPPSGSGRPRSSVPSRRLGWCRSRGAPSSPRPS